MNKNYLGAGLIAIAVILFWVLVLPAYIRISDLDAAIRERNDLLTSRSAIVANIKKLNTEYQKRIPEITKLSAIVPAKKSIAEVLSAINDVSTKNGLQLFSSSITGQNASEAIAIPYNILSLEISLIGNYPALTNFLRALERNLRLMDIISIDAASISVENASILNFNVKGNAYYLK